ncbi:hypothetical protein ASPZODRAFT_64184 [Penicilliopsis zonata CBS 506.65]|uniref:Sulfite efflux pump SSU1 n=1 Tax=Penicilliopsis zonata CBS 506.65 TaxID=1073090 RepID=A0A1L9SLV8_9EURO|nr:hypothetical protein ASPZODRAFT_64184 [Penicilliopsis zonata CBS 506.65]OJJ48034.1 hypothetical protein ASPZODRAFT_64184 [Penicilliopsis zonata CBS 506.65]
MVSSSPGEHNPLWREIVVTFSPAWFTVSMGTGIVSILLYYIPFTARWLYYLSIVFFILNTVLFFSILFMLILRLFLAPGSWRSILHNPSQAPFISTLPISLSTLVEMWVFICVPILGDWARTMAWILWMVNAVIAVAVTTSLTFFLITKSSLNSLDMFNAVQLLPIAATIVASGVGAEVAGIILDAHRAAAIVVASYVLWGMATPLAGVILVLYYQRLIVHKLPATEVIVTSLLPLSPLGFGSYSIMYLGKVARTVFPETDILDSAAGQAAYLFGFFIALIMWSFGITWLVLAIAAIYRTWPFSFNMGWWGFTFPTGVFAASTIQIGLEMHSVFFRVLGTVFSAAVIILWILVAAATVRDIYPRVFSFRLDPKE